MLEHSQKRQLFRSWEKGFAVKTDKELPSPTAILTPSRRHTWESMDRKTDSKWSVINAYRVGLRRFWDAAHRRNNGATVAPRRVIALFDHAIACWSWFCATTMAMPYQG